LERGELGVKKKNRKGNGEKNGNLMTIQVPAKKRKLRGTETSPKVLASSEEQTSASKSQELPRSCKERRKRKQKEVEKVREAE